MFKNFFSRKKTHTQEPTAPEVMGLRIGGAFEIDDLKLKLIEPALIIEGAANTHFIQAVGVVKLDGSTTVLRFYTDDDAFIQILLEGGMDENHISDVKLWYFYDTKSIATDEQWNKVLNHSISQQSIEIEGYNFLPVWENATGAKSAPVAMTEKTYTSDPLKSDTDQFCMMYEREAQADLFEYAMISGEEKIINNRIDRCLVTMTGFDLQPADIEIIG